MTDEPRYTLRTWFNTASGVGSGKVTAANLTKRDSSQATFEADFEMTETDLVTLFAQVDLVFIIKKIRAEPIMAGRQTVGYKHFIGVEPAVVNKFSDDTLNIEGSELLGKALSEIRRIVREQIDTGGTIMHSQEQPASQRYGSTILYGDTVIVRFDQYV